MDDPSLAYLTLDLFYPFVWFFHFVFHTLLFLLHQFIFKIIFFSHSNYSVVAKFADISPYLFLNLLEMKFMLNFLLKNSSSNTKHPTMNRNIWTSVWNTPSVNWLICARRLTTTKTCSNNLKHNLVILRRSTAKLRRCCESSSNGIESW